MAFDLETTGLVPGWTASSSWRLLHSRSTGAGELSALVDPGIPIPPVASRVNGITDQMVKGAPPIEDALPAFLRFLGQGTPVAHNAAFDVGFLAAEIHSKGHIPPAGPVLDTRGLARRGVPRPEQATV